MKKDKINLKKVLILVIAIVLIIFIIAIIPSFSNNKTNAETNTEETNNTAEDVNSVGSASEPTAPKPFVILNNESNKELNESTIGKLENGLPILMYHNFYDKQKGEKGPNSNWMEISDFENQMKYLSENNYYFPSWEEVNDYLDGAADLPAKSVVITIDDGDPSFFSEALPVLQEYNIIATSFVVTSWSADKVAEYKSSPNIRFESHSNDMHKAGSDGKGYFLTATKEQAIADLEQTKAILGTNIVFCYPYGDYSDFTEQILQQEGYKIAVTTKSGRAKPGMDKLALPRVRMSKGDSLDNFITRVK